MERELELRSCNTPGKAARLELRRDARSRCVASLRQPARTSALDYQRWRPNGSLRSAHLQAMRFLPFWRVDPASRVVTLSACNFRTTGTTRSCLLLGVWLSAARVRAGISVSLSRACQRAAAKSDHARFKCFWLFMLFLNLDASRSVVSTSKPVSTPTATKVAPAFRYRSADGRSVVNIPAAFPAATMLRIAFSITA